MKPVVLWDGVYWGSHGDTEFVVLAKLRVIDMHVTLIDSIPFESFLITDMMKKRVIDEEFEELQSIEEDEEVDSDVTI